MVDVENFAAAIGMNLDILNALPLDKADCSGFYDSPKAFITKAKQNDNYNAYMAAVYLKLGANAKQRYLDKGFSERIYFDTMRDIALWTEVYRFESGKDGIAQSEVEWLIAHMSADIATLGRLQFKPSHLDEEIVLPCGKKYNIGDSFIEVHIPRGASLTEHSVTDAFNQAQGYYGSNVLYGCYSWMLSPALKQVLPEKSNILRFGDLFYRTYTDPLNDSAERYISFAVFSHGETTLSKGLKVLKTQGKTVGASSGWLVR